MDPPGYLLHGEEGPLCPATPKQQITNQDRSETPYAPRKSKAPPIFASRVDARASLPAGQTLTFLQRLQQLAAKDQGPQRGSPGPLPSRRNEQPPAPRPDPALRPGEAPSSPTPAPRLGVRLRAAARGMSAFYDRNRAGQPASQQHQQPQQQPQAQTSQQFQNVPHQSAHGQNSAAMNGMNGGGVPGGMVGMPTPAGHQSELNYIYSLVEELSKQLADNRRQTENIVAGIGRVRNRARNQSLGNEELINAASEEVNGEEKNLDTLVSVLTEALETAKHSRDANAALLSEYAGAMRNMLRQVHDYKANQVEEISSWHRSYRSQLAAEREENCRLREQIWEMQSRAGRANEMLREFRRRYEEGEERWDRRVDDVATRQEIRFWKRMAMPEVPDDDAYWSDDDDLIDIREKIRLREEQQIREEQERLAQQQDEADEEVHDLPDDQDLQASGVYGSVAMQRDESAPGALSLPSRPASAASTGSSGQ